MTVGEPFAPGVTDSALSPPSSGSSSLLTFTPAPCALAENADSALPMPPVGVAISFRRMHSAPAKPTNSAGWAGASDSRFSPPSDWPVSPAQPGIGGAPAAGLPRRSSSRRLLLAPNDTAAAWMAGTRAAPLSSAAGPARWAWIQVGER